MPITEKDLLEAREAWGAALIAISNAFDAGGIDAAKTEAEKTLDIAYGYDLGPVLFKPTLASGDQTFRPTRSGALAYFVGHDQNYPLDSGFGLKGWKHFSSKTSAHFIEGDVGMWMGAVILTDKNGNQTIVDKSFGYKKDQNGHLKIVLHHSSLPYQPA